MERTRQLGIAFGLEILTWFSKLSNNNKFNIHLEASHQMGGRKEVYS